MSMFFIYPYSNCNTNQGLIIRPNPVWLLVTVRWVRRGLGSEHIEMNVGEILRLFWYRIMITTDHFKNDVSANERRRDVPTTGPIHILALDRNRLCSPNDQRISQDHLDIFAPLADDEYGCGVPERLCWTDAIIEKRPYSDVTWASWRLKSPTTHMTLPHHEENKTNPPGKPSMQLKPAQFIIYNTGINYIHNFN